jgi:hypothetical protein
MRTPRAIRDRAMIAALRVGSERRATPEGFACSFHAATLLASSGAVEP